MDHAFFMHRCLELAANGRKDVGNGALVGSVLVRGEQVIAEGYHDLYGNSHAERALLQKYEQKIDSNDVLYVNLEPCCHTGKTPPCTDIILEKGIKHVVVGMLDPDPRVSGKGIENLCKNGVIVEGPVLRAECEWLNRGFISVRTKQRPWIALKRSATGDQRIANDNGSPLKITSKDQDIWSHTFLRARHDAILVGVQTVINDNPTLDARLAPTPGPSPDGGGGKRFVPWRIVLDPHGRIPQDAKVVTDANKESTIVIVGLEYASNVDSLEKNGIHVFSVPFDGHSFVWNELWNALLTSREGFNGLTSILVEGGAKTWDAFKDAGMVDMEVSLTGVSV